MEALISSNTASIGVMYVTFICFECKRPTTFPKRSKTNEPEPPGWQNSREFPQGPRGNALTTTSSRDLRSPTSLSKILTTPSVVPVVLPHLITTKLSSPLLISSAIPSTVHIPENLVGKEYSATSSSGRSCVSLVSCRPESSCGI